MIDLTKYESPFCQRSKQSVKHLQKLIMIWDKNTPPEQDDLEESQRVVHNLKGGGAMLGCQGLSNLAGVMESIFKNMIDGQKKISPQLIKNLELACKVILEKLDNFSELKKSDFSDLIKKLSLELH